MATDIDLEQFSRFYLGECARYQAEKKANHPAHPIKDRTVSDNRDALVRPNTQEARALIARLKVSGGRHVSWSEVSQHITLSQQAWLDLTTLLETLVDDIERIQVTDQSRDGVVTSLESA